MFDKCVLIDECTRANPTGGSVPASGMPQEAAEVTEGGKCRETEAQAEPQEAGSTSCTWEY